jgi:hypothetical protein
MFDILAPTFDWIKNDFKSNKLRFCLEVTAWVLSISCSLAMALTVPNPPLKYLYIPWVISTSIYAGCAYSRRSFGMLANYMLLAIIDGIALSQWWF